MYTEDIVRINKNKKIPVFTGFGGSYYYYHIDDEFRIKRTGDFDYKTFEEHEPIHIRMVLYDVA